MSRLASSRNAEWRYDENFGGKAESYIFAKCLRERVTSVYILVLRIISYK